MVQVDTKEKKDVKGVVNFLSLSEITIEEYERAREHEEHNSICSNDH